MKKILGLSLLLALVGCKESDLTKENPEPDPSNVVVATSFIYGDEGIMKDSIRMNSLGQRYIIEDIKMVWSELYFSYKGDTVIYDDRSVITTLSEPIAPAMTMPPGGYSGNFGLTFGVDSLASWNLIQPSKTGVEELVSNGLYRNDGFGVNQLVITGRLFDPTNVDDSTGTIPLSYNIGTYFIARDLIGVNQNFSVGLTNKMKIILQVDFEEALEDFNFFNTPTLNSTFTDPTDFALSKEMADKVEIDIF